MTGFAEQQARLEEISGAKQQKDEEKGKAMEDISQMVQKLQVKIEEQRETIEPLLNRVRLVDYVFFLEWPSYKVGC